MGTLAPVLGTLTQTLGALQTLSTTVDTFSGRDERNYRAQQELAMQNLQAQQGLSLAEAQKKAEAERRQLALNAQADEKRRQDALRRAIARQNATRGAGGISTSGSNEAILLGLYNDADEDRDYASALDQLRYNTLDTNLSNLQSRSVLDRTQLAERQRLDRTIQNY
tara:strand:+ start:247 stop:747 length:501 start_codon:yes stop_codon:yes gene_type:complete